MESTPIWSGLLKRTLSIGLLGIFALLLIPDANAQNLRPEDTFYIKPRVGVAWYLADTEKSPFNFNMDNWTVEDEPPPFAAGLEFGYQYSQTASVSLGWQITNHPLAFTDEEVPTPPNDPAGFYNGGQLLFRFAAPTSVAPFLAIGGHVTKGQDGRSSLTYGPAVGLGLDIVVSDRMSLVLENLANLTFPDDGFDNREDDFDEESFLPFDIMNALTLGLKINFKSAFTPVEILSLDCPAGTLEQGDAATFTASVNADATQPVDIRWDFGDGTTATGMTARHSWSTPGTYNVTVSAGNDRATDTESCTVRVEAPPAPARITSIDASETRFDVCEPVEVDFEADVQGDEPVTYRWDFGDGTTGTGEEVSHTYTNPGTYTVTLTTTNDAGSDTRSMTITAETCVAEICYDITEMNSVFFERNSSTLTDEGSDALGENVEIFEQCPNLCANIVGYAAPGERNPQQLSEDRARAVEDFYVENGLAASRFTVEGQGVLPGTTKKEGASQARRVDTIPVQCEDLD